MMIERPKPTLFIDVDDTLVTWLGEYDEPHPYGFGAERWRPNQSVIALAKAWRCLGWPVVVWSGGGADYAQMWARRLLDGVFTHTFAKFNALYMQGDVFIDDLPFEAWASRSIHPRELGPV